MRHPGALSLSLRVAVLVAIVASVGGTGAAQRVLPSKPGPDDFDAAAEMKSIRAEIREAGRTMVAAQVVVGRLLLIDRRMSYLASELADVRRERALNDPTREASLRAREAQLRGQMSTLELRWTALEARLEQLERAAGRDGSQ
jgi:hypothetical protein